MKLNSELLIRATGHARQLYAVHKHGAEWFEQAIRLVQQCNVIAVQNELEEAEKMKIQLAGLFLFSGGKKNVFGEDSILALKEFLNQESVEEREGEEIAEIIRSVKPPQMPMNIGGQVLCDALNSFWIEETKGPVVDLPVWVQDYITQNPLDKNLKEWIKYLEKLKFLTPAAQKLYDKPKKKKLGWFQKAYEQQETNPIPAGAPAHPIDYLMKDAEKPQMARGTETMFRIASREHAELMSNVHQKSGFLASINAIILSVILSVLSPQLGENPHLIIPTILLLITCVSTIYYVILATRPVFINPSNEGFNLETQNIMFFGHFSNMVWKDYRDKLKIITKDDTALFDTFSKNIYYQGLVLRKKYNLLAVGYNVFMGGLIVSILAFVISLVVHAYSS